MKLKTRALPETHNTGAEALGKSFVYRSIYDFSEDDLRRTGNFRATRMRELFPSAANAGPRCEARNCHAGRNPSPGRRAAFRTLRSGCRDQRLPGRNSRQRALAFRRLLRRRVLADPLGFSVWCGTLSFFAALWLVRGNEEFCPTRDALQAIANVDLLVGVYDRYDDPGRSSWAVRRVLP